jgi:DNA segregation ATPase FtsK/SpoIIIE, S-DNA-T family
LDVVLIDGLAAVRRSLDEPGSAHDAMALDRVLAEGPAVGVVTAAVVEPDGGSTLALLARFAERWIFHLDDASTASMVGVPAARVPASIPGRLVIASSGLEAQVLTTARPQVPVPAVAVPRIDVLPARVLHDTLDAPDDPSDHGIAVGRRFDDLSVARLEVAPGDRLVIAGPPGSGRSTLLAGLLRSWQRAWPDHRVVVLTGSDRSPLAGSSWRRHVDDLGDLLDGATSDATSAGSLERPNLVVVDDAERVLDHRGLLAEIAAARGGGTTMLVAGRADTLRGFDHWSAPARRHRLGFVMSATSELDGDVLGVTPPRRCPLPPRPGLAWMIAHGGCALVQTALPGPAAAVTPG